MIPLGGAPGKGVINSFGQLEIASQVNYIMLITLARLSVLLLYRRIFTLDRGRFRVAWWSCTALTLAYFVALTTSFLVQCHGALHDPRACRNTHSAASRAPMIGGFLNVFLDLAIWMLPVRMVWMLHLSPTRKVGVAAMFALGLIGVAVSIARATVLLDINVFANGRGISFSCWSTAEPAVALLCANLPLLRPLLIRTYDKLSAVCGNKSSHPQLDDVALKRYPPTFHKEKDMIVVFSTQEHQSSSRGVETPRGPAEPDGLI